MKHHSGLWFWPALLWVCMGCNQSKTLKIDISAPINQHLQTTPNQPIDLAVLGPKSWQKVCVITPYSDNESAARILGVEWDAENQTSIQYSDSITLLVFVEAQKVVAFAEHPRRYGDFTKVQPPCLGRAEAKVVREPNPRKPEGVIFLIRSQ